VEEDILGFSGGNTATNARANFLDACSMFIIQMKQKTPLEKVLISYQNSWKEKTKSVSIYFHRSKGHMNTVSITHDSEKPALEKVGGGEGGEGGGERERESNICRWR
jgi:hypothetical protein